MISFSNDDPRQPEEGSKAEGAEERRAPEGTEEDDAGVIYYHRHMAREADRAVGIIALSYYREDGKQVTLTPSQAGEVTRILEEVSTWLEESAAGMAHVVEQLNRLPPRKIDR